MKGYFLTVLRDREQGERESEEKERGERARRERARRENKRCGYRVISAI